MLLAQKRPDCHERSRAGLALRSGGAFALFSDGKVQVDQERTPGEVVIVLVNHEIVDGDVSVKEARLAQGFVSFNAALQCCKESRSGACLVDGFSVVPKNDTPMHPVWHCVAAGL